MDYIIKNDKGLLILPALLSFILTLLLLYKFTYPISWDVYYHIHMINLYLEKGLVFWDFQTVAPKGRLILYPPLFHLLFAQIAKLLNVAPVTLCKYAQPFFSFYLIGIITYVSYKLSDVKCAFFTGFLSMFCFVTFNRSVICTPATIAIGLFMLACLFFYQSIEENSLKSLFFSALSLALIWNLHMATALLTCGVIGLYGLIQLLRKKLSIKFVLVYILMVFVMGMPWWIYIALNYNIFFNSLSGTNLLLYNFFFRYYGIVPSILLVIGYYNLIRERNSKSLFLFVWTFSLLLVSQVYLLGFHVVSIRILEVVSYCLILVSGIGLYCLYEKFINNLHMRKFFVLLLVLLSVFSALLYVDSYTPDLLSDNDSNSTIIDENIHLLINPVTTLFKPTVISSRYADATLVHDRYDVMQYLINNNSDGLVVSEDSIMDTIIVSSTNYSVVYGGFTESIPEYVTDPVHIVKGWADIGELDNLNVKFILLKHETPIPYYAEMVYTNSKYKLCKIK